MALSGLWLLVLLGVSLAASFFFSGSETGLITADPLRVRYLGTEGRWGARQLDRLLAEREQSLIAILIGNNVALVVATVATVGLLQHAFLALAWPSEQATRAARFATPFVLTPIILFGCEILPKSIFRARPIVLTAAAAPILAAFRWLVSPIASGLAWSAHALARGLQHGPVERQPLVTREEMVRLFLQGEAGGAIDAQERKMIEGIIDFGQTTVAEVMVPRPQVMMARSTATCGELYDLIAQEGHSRIPIYADRVDDIVGIVHVRDLLAEAYEATAPITGLCRDALSVPESMRLDDLLRELRQTRRSVAIVIDEHGGTAGLVTVEDLIEEIVGEIRDEYDEHEAPEYRRLPDGSVLVTGGMRLDDARDGLGWDLPDTAVVETVGGFLVQLQGRIPRVGEMIVYGNLQFHVVAATDRAVQRVRVRRRPGAEVPRL